MSRTTTPMIALIVVASPLLSSGLKLNLDTDPHPFHHIDFEQFHQDWSNEIRNYMTSSVEDRPSKKIGMNAGFQGRCRGDICNIHGSSAPALFMFSRSDGNGARLQSITGGMALAAKHGMNFGGAVGLNKKDKRHDIDIVPMMSALYGTDIRADDVPADAVVFKTVDALEDFFKKGHEIHNTSVRLEENCVQCAIDHLLSRSKTPQLDDYYTPEFLNHIRRANTLSKHTGGPGEPVVALHVRRGDAKGRPARLTDDEYYYNMVREIKKHLPKASVHVFSEGSPTQFVGYEERGMHLHLDSDNVIEAWEYFSSADIVITAKSSFSHVPALFNPNCVIYQIFWHHPLDEWMIVDPNETTIHDDELEACIHRIKQ